MASNRNYTGKVNTFIGPFLEKNGYELIRTEFTEEDHNWFLRLYIDLAEAEYEKRLKELQEDRQQEALPEEALQEAAADGEESLTPGVSINDCVKVSRYLSKWLDKEDFIKEAYTLEVCSRGFLDGQLPDSTKGENG